MPGAENPTQLLLEWGRGDNAALDRLMPLVHDELRRLAVRYMSRERKDHTLQPTALVNEVYLRLIEINKVQWQSRAHFFAMAARLMRRILVDFARARGNLKRGGAVDRLPLEDALVFSPAQSSDLIELDSVLQRLEELDARQGRVVELRFFGGLTVEETAAVIGVSPDTVKRDWRVAKLWLLRELTGDPKKTPGPRRP
jgi:RNA polymerase sigma factor (TIGR02999 family)